jgi:hypothetical protein
MLGAGTSWPTGEASNVALLGSCAVASPVLALEGLASGSYSRGV